MPQQAKPAQVAEARRKRAIKAQAPKGLYMPSTHPISILSKLTSSLSKETRDLNHAH